VDANAAAANFYGYSLIELHSMHIADLTLLSGEKLKDIKNAAPGKAYRFDSRHKLADGSFCDVEILSNAVELSGRKLLYSVIIDISRKKAAEAALKEEKIRLESIIYGTNPGTWEWNVQTGETVFNERWAEIIGYQLAELEPVSIHTWEMYAHPGDLALSSEMLQKHFRKEIPFYDIETRMKHKDGSWVYVHDRGRVVSWTDDGKPLMMYGTHTDITQRKYAEEQAQIHLKEKEIILREVHHRVKNNLNTVLSLIALETDMLEDKSTREVLVRTAGRIKTMLVLYNKLYIADISGRISLKDYLPDLIAEIIGSFPHKNTITLDAQIDEIIVDSRILSPLGIILYEFTSNALKYAFNEREKGIITIIARLKENNVSFTFADNGPGIPESVSLENSPGFGLQLAQLLVKQLRGTLLLKRQNGTCYVIEFPV
ncbi:MAG: sensor histidine kinase, partial [Syntrophothermus sp.]